MKCLANELFPFQAVYQSGKAGPWNSLISSYSKLVKENSNSLVMQSCTNPKRGVFLAALGSFPWFFKSRLDLLQTLAPDSAQKKYSCYPHKTRRRHPLKIRSRSQKIELGSLPAEFYFHRDQDCSRLLIWDTITRCAPNYAESSVSHWELLSLLGSRLGNGMNQLPEELGDEAVPMDSRALITNRQIPLFSQRIIQRSPFSSLIGRGNDQKAN